MSQVATNCYQYLYPSEWVREGGPWRVPDALTLRDEAGVALGTTAVNSVVLTLYNLSDPHLGIIGTLEQTDIKNTRGCTLSPQGVLVVNLLSSDTGLIIPSNPYELRRCLIEYTWPLTPTKSDAIEITFAIRNIGRRPYVAS